MKRRDYRSTMARLRAAHPDKFARVVKLSETYLSIDDDPNEPMDVFNARLQSLRTTEVN